MANSLGLIGAAIAKTLQGGAQAASEASKGLYEKKLKVDLAAELAKIDEDKQNRLADAAVDRDINAVPRRALARLGAAPTVGAAVAAEEEPAALARAAREKTAYQDRAAFDLTQIPLKEAATTQATITRINTPGYLEGLERENAAKQSPTAKLEFNSKSAIEALKTELSNTTDAATRQQLQRKIRDLSGKSTLSATEAATLAKTYGSVAQSLLRQAQTLRNSGMEEDAARAKELEEQAQAFLSQFQALEQQLGLGSSQPPRSRAPDPGGGSPNPPSGGTTPRPSAADFATRSNPNR